MEGTRVQEKLVAGNAGSGLVAAVAGGGVGVEVV